MIIEENLEGAEVDAMLKKKETNRQGMMDSYIGSN